MANGINDILSVYRQSISSERQTRLAEMQMSLQSLQAQSERRFQEEGRQRENALFSLKHAEERTKEAIGKDAGTMVAALSGLMETNDDQELYDFKDQDTLKASGLSQEDQMTAYTIVSMYSSDSESLQKLYQSQGSEQLINRLRSLKEIVKNEFISQKQENNR